MENSETQKEVINLGKLFVKELQLERGSNTFSRWVAHYIAEKIKKAERSKGEEQLQAQNECFDAILKLWQHRWLLPHGRRPLENFEPLLNLLQKLIPEKEEPYFFPAIPTELKPSDNTSPEVGSSQFWVAVAEQVDKVARIWLQDILKLAAFTAIDGQDHDWLVNSVNVPDNDDRRVIQLILTEETLGQKSSSIEETIKEIDVKRKTDIEKHKSRIDLLERYIGLNEFLIEYHKEELAHLEKLESIDKEKPTPKRKVKKNVVQRKKK